MTIFNTRMRMQESIEELQMLLADAREENDALTRAIELKDEIIKSKDEKLKRLEKRIERMLWELRLSDVVLMGVKK